jgi:NAD(P)-dependent dehydrogenase (short-subunit alcohol dehydrogenase family)
VTTQKAVVTGASSGIGKATAVLLAEQGFDLAVAYRTDLKGARATADLVTERGASAHVFPLDLSDPARAATAVDQAAEAIGGIDVLVNSAGSNHRSPFVDLTLQDWERILTIDLTGQFAISQTAARRMIEQGRGGRIIHVSSVHELIPIRDGAAYCAAKGGLGLLTRVMALELAEHGITVNSVCPGETATPMNGVPEDVDAADLARPGIPLGRPGRPGEIAAFIAYLAQPGSAYTTGASHVIDGGLTLMSAIPNQEDAGRL